jgi:hypothetical protein
MLSFQHCNDAVRSQVVHFRAFVAIATIQWQVASSWIFVRNLMHGIYIYQTYGAWSLLPTVPQETCPCCVVIPEGPGELQFAAYMHATKDSCRFFNPWNRLHGAGQWLVEALELNPVALKFLSWMISHAAWHLMLLLSLQIVLELGPATNCKFCPCPQLIRSTLHQHNSWDTMQHQHIIAADQAVAKRTWFRRSKPHEFEWNSVSSRQWRS